jgi:hypothetical protein
VKLDLDAAADEIEKRRAAWASAGFSVGALTWLDTSVGWPYRLVSRAEVDSPLSVGVRCVRRDIEFAVALYDGRSASEEGGPGWADVEGVNYATGEIDETSPEIADIAAFGRLLDQTFEQWAASDDSV